MIAVPYLWLILFFLAPFFIVLKISISEPAIAQPPYTPTWDSWDAVLGHLGNPSLENYAFLFSDWLYVGSYLTSVKIAAISTLLALLVAYPMAYGIARANPAWRPTLLALVILPFWTSFLIRVYAWVGILKGEGLLNSFLDWSGVGAVIETVLGGLAALEGALFGTATLPTALPEQILYTRTAVYIGIVYSYLPFMILPLYASLEKLDGSLLEAASDLGARPMTSFFFITLPLSLPGIAAGCFLVFIPAVGEFVIPELLGGSSTQMIGRTLWSEFFQNRDWPIASAVAVLLLLILVVPIVIFQSMAKREGAG
jgi:putrescine transport system permease protein